MKAIKKAFPTPKGTSANTELTYSTKGSTKRKLSKTWSGITFMTEFEDYFIENEYAKNQAEAVAGRQKWDEVKKKLIVQQFQEKTSNAGPKWFQDLSPYQMELTDNLHLMLHGDIEEKQTPRTQEYLFNIGIAPELPPDVVAKAVKESAGNPIVFLFKVHESLSRLETEEYEKAYFEGKKVKKIISPYSINERILLTCAFHIHYPKFLEKLDKILPTPEPEPKVLWGNRAPKKKKTYSSPYLEPQPINERPWYEEQAMEELHKKVIARAQREKAKKEKEEFEKKLVEEKKMAETEKAQRENMRNIYTSTQASSSAKPWKQKHFCNEEVFVSDDVMSKASLEKIDKNLSFSLRDRKSAFFNTLKNPNFEEPLITEEQDNEFLKWLLELQNDSSLWVEVIVSEGCGQTPIRGVGPATIYADYVPDPEAPNEGVTPAFELNIRKARVGETKNKWTQTGFTQEFRPLKKLMRDFILKQRAVEKQMERFYVTALQKRGIFGPPTDALCKTNCLLDLEKMAVDHEIKIIKPPSSLSLNNLSDNDLDTISTFCPIPRDISFKEILNVNRLIKPDQKNGIQSLQTSQSPLNIIVSTSEKSKDVQKESQEDNKNECGQTCHFEKKPITVECKDPTCELINTDELPIDEFAFAQRRIAVLPPKKQLSVAVQYLCDKGDPLAVLPDIVDVPWLIRWFEKRRGVKKILTEQDKRELMEKSKNFWSAEYHHCTMAPLPPKLEGNYTWSHKKWMTDVTSKKLYEHRRGVKHILIDNARDLFPSMFCEYFNTPLNRAYRKLFYTYFPSCERDCQVISPWDPNEENKNQENNEED